MYTGWSPEPKYRLSHVIHGAGALPSCGVLNWMRMLGSISTEEAKMTGMTLAMFTLTGM